MRHTSPQVVTQAKEDSMSFSDPTKLVLVTFFLFLLRVRDVAVGGEFRVCVL